MFVFVINNTPPPHNKKREKKKFTEPFFLNRNQLGPTLLYVIVRNSIYLLLITSCL